MKKRVWSYDRLTVTLGPGQRDALDAIAKRNNATLAFVVRYALEGFISSHRHTQLALSFPNLTTSDIKIHEGNSE